MISAHQTQPFRMLLRSKDAQRVLKAVVVHMNGSLHFLYYIHRCVQPLCLPLASRASKGKLFWWKAQIYLRIVFVWRPRILSFFVTTYRH